MLLRDGLDGLEVFLMRRVTQMSFAPGMYVFPGGRLDDADLRAVSRVVGTPDERATRGDVDLARGLLVCAVRETFEEAAVLLASGSDWARAATEDKRRAVEGGLPICDFLAEHDLVIEAQRVPLWSHWVTPEVEPRRFDVRFFVAALPADAVAHDISGESDHAKWVRPQDAIALSVAGEMPILPPTAATLREIGEHASVAEVMAEAPRRELRPLLPHPTDSGWVLIDAYTREVVLAETEARVLREVDGILGRPQ